MEERTVVPAVLSGRSSRHKPQVVHAVAVSSQELRSGIKFYANSLCGKTHGARSAGWAHGSEWVITCAKCLKLADQFNQRGGDDVLLDPMPTEFNAERA